jgi:hypothetical protein
MSCMPIQPQPLAILQRGELYSPGLREVSRSLIEIVLVMRSVSLI